MGMPSENIYITINTVDTQFFTKHSEEYRLKKEYFKKQYQYPDINLLYVGHITEQKGLQYLIKALGNIKDFDKIAALHIVGSGPYEEKLRSLQTEMSLKNIIFHGFRQKDQLPFFYGICDIFVFPSLYDIWGLVCIEAMATDLPVICSVYCGINYDLIHNYNSLIVDTKNTDEFTAQIQLLIQNPDFRKLISRNGFSSIADKFNLNRTSKSFLTIVNEFSKNYTC
jgi:glycosyltransferase involved in cell wall biosynthesis